MMVSTTKAKVLLSEKIRTLIMIYGLIMAVFYICLMAYTWMRAYFAPNHMMILSVNFVGEASPEFVLLFLEVPVIVYTAWNLGKDLYFKIYPAR